MPDADDSWKPRPFAWVKRMWNKGLLGQAEAVGCLLDCLGEIDSVEQLFAVAPPELKVPLERRLRQMAEADPDELIQIEGAHRTWGVPPGPERAQREAAYQPVEARRREQERAHFRDMIQPRIQSWLEKDV